MSMSKPLLNKPKGLIEALQIATPDELKFIIDILLDDNIDGILPNSESKKRLRSARASENPYDFIDDIAFEIRSLGSVRIASFFRNGRPVEYDEIVRDVAKELSLKTIESESVEHTEQAILKKLESKLEEKAKDRAKFSDGMNFSKKILEGSILGRLSSVTARTLIPMASKGFIVWAVAEWRTKSRKELDSLGLIVACVAAIRDEFTAYKKIHF